MDISRLAGEALLLNRPLASLLLSERVCPIGVVQHLAGESDDVRVMGEQKPYEIAHDTSRADVMAAALTRATRGVRHRHAIQVETERGGGADAGLHQQRSELSWAGQRPTYPPPDFLVLW
ncbi:unnamed protein product [Arctia plantaginis]|uniref:Uncharacterized protein n=1 Tax=Arctia plantaginis TaxID=874455 RepID=A0A8S0Z9R9_ARCPL|nr:unnamed protein product [Arctia plantaginis]